MPPEAGALPPLIGAPVSGPKGAASATNARLANLLRDHFRRIWCAIRRLGVPAESADDATQEVFIIAARKLALIEEGHEGHFLYGIALRVAANRRRAMAARRELADEAALLAAVSKVPAADALLEEKRMRAWLDVALESLSDELRSAFVLHELEGLTQAEIAEVCAIPAGTAASRLRRAREAFDIAIERLRSKWLGAEDTP